MKKYIITLLFLIIPAIAAPQSDITFTVGFTGTPNIHDIRGAKFAIAAENARRAELDPPATPLPDSTNAEIKASYLEILNLLMAEIHSGNVNSASEASDVIQEISRRARVATDAQRAAALSALQN